MYAERSGVSWGLVHFGIYSYSLSIQLSIARWSKLPDKPLDRSWALPPPIPDAARQIYAFNLSLSWLTNNRRCATVGWSKYCGRQLPILGYESEGEIEREGERERERERDFYLDTFIYVLALLWCKQFDMSLWQSSNIRQYGISRLR